MNETEILKLYCDCGGEDTVEAIKGSTRIVRAIKLHTCTLNPTIENSEYAYQYAYACGYHD